MNKNEKQSIDLIEAIKQMARIQVNYYLETLKVIEDQEKAMELTKAFMEVFLKNAQSNEENTISNIFN